MVCDKMITEKDEPFTVTTDENNNVVLTCKNPAERDLVIKKLKWSVVFRKIHADPNTKSKCLIPCKNEKDLNKKLAIIFTTMRIIRVKL